MSMNQEPNRQESAALVLIDEAQLFLGAVFAASNTAKGHSSVSDFAIDNIERNANCLHARLERLVKEIKQSQVLMMDLERELTTSRAATDKTRQEADALMEQVPRWRPIESAPKDGAPLLCLIPGRFTAPRMRVLRWKADRWVLDGQSDNDFYQPSHWMPLPLPPKETT